MAIDMILGADRRWWGIPEDEERRLAQAVVTAAHEVNTVTAERQYRIIRNYCLYGDVDSWPNFYNFARRMPAGSQLSHNVIANAVDALISEVTTTQPRPMATTVAGSYGDYTKAKKLTSYWDGKFLECRVQDIAPQVARDAAIAGLGILRAYTDHGRAFVERIFPINLLVDDRGCVDTSPRVIYLRRHLDKFHLAELYPEYAAAIESASSLGDDAFASGADSTMDLVEVVEAWHLPSYEPYEDDDETDGRHVIAIDGAVLYDEEWRRTTFPFAFIHAIPPQRGFWGRSLVDRAVPAQRELNKLLRRVQEAQHKFANPWVFVNRQSKIVKQHLQNQIGAIIEYDGNPPSFVTPPAMAREIYDHIDRLARWVYQEMGVSELSASSLKPSGLDSGAALRTYNDVQSRRFLSFERGYEQLHVQIARELTYAERTIAEEDPEHHVVYEGSAGRSQRINWAELDLDDEVMRIQVKPTSAFSTSPAARVQELAEARKEGLITDVEFYQKAPVADFEGARERIVAPVEYIHKRLEDMLETGEYVPPEPFMDLAQGRDLAARLLQSAELKGADEDKLEVLRRWWDEAGKTLDRMAAAAAPPPPEMPMGPEMMPPPEGMPGELPPEMGLPPELPPGMGGLPPGPGPMN